LEEAAQVLAENTGWDTSRWLHTIRAAIAAKHLPLKNPQDLTDNLPYPVPSLVREFYDQVSGEDVNTWLDANPVWKVTYRIPSPAQGSAVEKSITEAAGDPPWVTETQRLADEIGTKKWLNGVQEITGRSICAPVANELNKNQENWGRRGPRTAGTVRKALKGWKFRPAGGANGASGAKGSRKAVAPRSGKQKPTKIVT